MQTEPEIQRGVSVFARRLAWLPWGLAAFLAGVALADPVANTTVRDFRVPEYYDPPHETRIKTLLEGAEAQPESGGRVLIRNLKLQTFDVDGRDQLLVEAPHCVFDTAQRAVHSPGRLQARTADGKFYLEGEGFLWQQTNSNLIISNRVHTVISSVPKKTPKS
jgi:hypothetical protein